MIAKLALAALLLLPGEGYWADDMPPKAQGAWLGLFAGASPRLATVPVALRALPARGEDARVTVVVKGATQPAFLVRGVPGLKPGPVAGARVTGGGIGVGDGARVGLGAHAWRLTMEDRDRHPDDRGAAFTYATRGALVLSDGRTRQVLFAFREGEVRDDAWQVLWAGDLDRDGRPDLLVEASDKSIGAIRRLYLSGGAGAGKLVREVAIFTTLGC